MRRWYIEDPLLHLDSVVDFLSLPCSFRFVPIILNRRECRPELVGQKLGNMVGLVEQARPTSLSLTPFRNVGDALRRSGDVLIHGRRNGDEGL